MSCERVLLVFVRLVLIAGMFSQVIYACSSPTPPEHMLLDLDHSKKKSVNSSFALGETVYFKCEEGYVMKGTWWTLAAKCHRNDTWVWEHNSKQIYFILLTTSVLVKYMYMSCAAKILEYSHSPNASK